MKKILILSFMLIILFLTGCTNEKELDFILISKDIPASNYIENSFVVMEDLDTFKTYFPDYKNEEKYKGIDEDFFSKQTLVYFEYIAEEGCNRRYVNIKTIFKKSKTLFFEIELPLVREEISSSQTLYCLVEFKTEELESIVDYQLIILNRKEDLNK